MYAHLVATPEFAETEISCVDETTQKAAGFGELEGGFLVRGIELGRCRALVHFSFFFLLACFSSFVREEREREGRED